VVRQPVGLNDINFLLSGLRMFIGLPPLTPPKIGGERCFQCNGVRQGWLMILPQLSYICTG
ncbi:MAG: hypothetical protein WD038_03320, partial [Balneolales bacterium]